eukprot:CAMPEP_0182419046 /NCGR_PEP_ID=MMETSP1167-20130531/3430_1 /TAXON_ID=2988 /ORGANISM="Mallomonas Sp, Strain CCMP3275" /LENGTH=1043 /DNA_ID=CAMNT_0024593625 /DNA_START=106 /DNA_END=3237 /DNA_ORIENTATION=+
MQNSPRPEDNFVPTQKDIDDYTALKTLLTEKLRKEGSLFVTKKSASGFVGLTNQGATVYLNSLIQTLYNTTAFRNAIFKYKGDAQVVKEFQRLFSTLRLSDSCATATTGLTTSLGWTSVEFFEERDAEEIISLLVDALGTASGELKVDLGGLFQGNKKVTMTCPECKTKTENAAPTLTVGLDILEASDALEDSVDRMLPGLTLPKLVQSCLSEGPIGANEDWTCTKCSKPQRALKKVEYTALPPVLSVHLKRFQTDPVSKRKVKLSHPVLFTDSLAASDIQADGSGNYKLYSILMHSGPAKGGHYKAIIRDSTDKWFEFDDFTVNALEPGDLTSLFWYNGQNASAGDTSASDLLYESAYMLIYAKDGVAMTATDLVPAELEKEVKDANAELAKLRDAYRVHQQMVELKTYVMSGSAAAVSTSGNTEDFALYLPRTKTLTEATAEAYEHAKASKLAVTTLEKCRLRRYEPSTDRLGETFMGREGTTLQLLGLYPTSPMALETIGDGEVFEEFNPSLMLLRLLIWDGKAGSEDGKVSGRVVKVVVPGESAATVGALRTAAATALSTSASQVGLVRAGHTAVFELKDDIKTLKQDCQVWPGDEIIAEILPEGTTFGSKESGVVTALRSGKKNIRIFFNNPVAGTITTVDADYSSVSPRRDDYPHYLDITLETTLKEVKNGIAVILGVDGKSFHVRKSANDPQLKDDSKTMKEYELSNNGVLHLVTGPGCELGEHMLRLELDTTPDASYTSSPADLVAMGEMAVREKATVASVKQMIFDKWDTLAKNVAKPASIAHISIRDGKGGVSLRDERLMGRCLLNMADGRKLVVMSLPAPVTIAATDVVLTIRLASYGTVQGAPEKGLSRPLETIVTKTSTVKALMDLLSSKFPFLREDPPLSLITEANEGEPEVDISKISAGLQPFCRQFAVAKAFSTGPALNLREIQKLKWNDIQVMSAEEAEISKEPLNLRDGSVIVVRGQKDYLTAKLQAKHKREAGGGDSLPARPSSRSSVGRPRSRGVTMRAKSSGKAPPVPEAGAAGLPNAPNKA